MHQALWRENGRVDSRGFDGRRLYRYRLSARWPVTGIKVVESLQAMADGAIELDMVVNIGKVLSKDWTYVANDIRAVVDGGPSEQGAL